jgi:hypothetical protein
MWQGKIEVVCALALGAALIISVLQGQKEISAPIITGLLGYMGRDLLYSYQKKGEEK